MHRFTDEVELAGHIIDSLLLPKVLDEITSLGGDYESRETRIGHNRHDPSYVRLEVSAPSAELLEKILKSIGQHGAVAVHQQDCRLVTADIAGTLPEGLVINVVREARGDRLNRVTHTGFVVVRDGKRYVRHARLGRAVVDEPIERFLGRHAQMRKWVVSGDDLKPEGSQGFEWER